MTKLCPRGKAAAKRKFKVYPSAYANAYASKICAGKIKDPSGVKRKDFKGPKPAKEGDFIKDEKLKEVFDDKTKKARFVPVEEIKKNKDRYLPISTKVKYPVKKRKFGGTSMNEIEKEGQKRKDIKKTRDMLMKAREEGGRFSRSDIDIAAKQAKKLRKSGRETGGRLSVSDIEKLMDAIPNFNVGGHSVMGSPVSVDVDGDTLSNPSASAYYKDLLK